MTKFSTSLIALLVVALLAPMASAADLGSGPDYSFLWNQFNAIKLLDGYALATSDFGLAVLMLDSTRGSFSQVNQLVLDNQALEVNVAGTLATVSTSAGLLYFVDISQLPELSLAGQTDLGSNVYDAVMVDDDLYLACGFDGLRHYAVQPDGGLQFVDSSLTPIHCVQVENKGSYLVVLDDYNGLLRYQPALYGIEQVVDRIMVPRRVQSFFERGDTLILALVDRELVYRATFDGQPGLVDSVQFSLIPEQVFAIDSFLVAVDTDQDRLEMMSTVDGRSLAVTLAPNLALQPIGDTYHLAGDPYVVLISGTLGLAGFNLRSLWYDPQPRQFYSHPGPVSALAFHNHRLCTGGVRNPLETYRLSRPLQTERDTALYSLIGADAIADGGDVLFAHIGSTNRTVALSISGTSVTTLSTLPSSSRPTRGMKYYDYAPNDSVSLLLIIGNTTVDVVTVSPNKILHAADIARLVEPIGDAMVIDSFLLVSTLDRQIHVFRIFNTFRAVYWWSTATEGSLDHMLFTGDRHSPDGFWRAGIGLGFDGNQMYEIKLRGDGFPLSQRLGSLPIEVETSTFDPDALFGVGPQGITILDIRQTIPTVTAYGGYGGNYVAYGDSVLAVSDGSAVHLYSYRNGTLVPAEEPPTSMAVESFLQPNYPNPFNPSTRIDFTMPEPGRVEIAVFDILGRRVATLLESVLPVGRHSVGWDGTDFSGDRVASGVYFYRMTTPRTSETRKMVLLK